MRYLPILALIALGACSTEGKVTPLLQSTIPLPAATTWSVGVRGCEKPAACEDVRSELVARLIGAGLAERVTPAGAAAPLALDVAITRTRTVSGTERVLFGALAGRNELAAVATLKDDRGATLRSFQVESGSAAHPFSGESGQSDARKRFAQDVISGLR